MVHGVSRLNSAVTSVRSTGSSPVASALVQPSFANTPFGESFRAGEPSILSRKRRRAPRANAICCAAARKSSLDEALLLGEPAEDKQRCRRTRLRRFGEGLHGLGFHKSASTINVEENAEASDEMNHARNRHVFVAVLAGQVLCSLRRRFYPVTRRRLAKVGLGSAKRSGSHRAWSLARADYPP